MKKTILTLALALLVIILVIPFTGCSGENGATGAIGMTGATGATGAQGATGATGAKGNTGTSGKDGISVTSATVNSSGHLIITLSNGQSIDAGNVKGAAGTPGYGMQGATGEKGEKGDLGAQGIQGIPGQQGEKGDPGQSAPFLALFPKTGDPDWEIIDGQVGGTLFYSPEGDEFGYCLQAYGLTSGTSYSLIYYADPWPGTGGCLIASGVPDTQGNLFLIGEHDIGLDIPVTADENYPVGGKIWLVLSSDYSGGQMIAWQPTEYLFEYDLILYTDTD